MAMQHVTECDEKTLEILQRMLRKMAIGRPVSFHVEGGMHRVEDAGRIVETPNGTVTFTVHVSGGAQDTGLLKGKPGVLQAIREWL
jgi:hypothetical protein